MAAEMCITNAERAFVPHITNEMDQRVTGEMDQMGEMGCVGLDRTRQVVQSEPTGVAGTLSGNTALARPRGFMVRW